MSSPLLTSERDRATLRSFAQRIDPSDAGAHNNLGVLYFNKGLHAEAAAAFTRALELDPKMEVARRNLEIAYVSTGYFDRRAAELRERLRARPDDREARWELGRAHLAVGEADEAVAQFTTLLDHHADDVAALVQLGLAEKARGDLERAQAWLERARTLDPASPLVHFYVGEVLYNRGLNDEALGALQRAIELNPDNPDAHFLLAFVLGDLGRHDEARAATTRATRLNPALSRAQANLSLDRYSAARYAELVTPRGNRRTGSMQVSSEGHLAHYNLGLAFRQKGYYAEALREYQLALERGEDRALVLQAMAEVQLLSGQPRAALELYDEVLQAHADSPKLWNERGVALHQEGSYEDAGASYRRALALDASYALAHNNLGVALFHAGSRDAAADAFRAALAGQPKFIKAWLNLALLLLRSKQHRLGLEAYRQVLASQPEHPVAWNGVGLVLTEAKRYADARNAFGRAIQARPDYAEAHYNLSFALSNTGDFQGALRETKRALELDPYYVPQKFELAIDVEYEHLDIAVAPDLGSARRQESAVETFSFDSHALDALFRGLVPAQDEGVAAADAAPASPPAAAEPSPFALAADYLSKGMFDRAAAEAARVMARGADRAQGFALLGEVFAARGLHGEALERFRDARAAAGAPDEASARGGAPADAARDALFGETRALLMLGRAREAQSAADALLAADGDRVETLLLVARVWSESGEHRRAIALLETARERAPTRADVLEAMGDVARAAGNDEEALAAYRGALAIDRDLALVRFQVAQLLSTRGDGDGAERELAAALEAVPTYAEAAMELARVRRRFGRAREALTPLVELLRRDPYNLDALLLLGESLMELGQPRDAAVAFDRILRFDPEHAGALYFQGAILADRGRYGDAIAQWREVFALAPASPYGERARRDARAAELQSLFTGEWEAVRAD